MLATQIQYWSLVETKRHNVAGEIETNRHNIATEREENRHNVAVETETNRHNLATEEYNNNVLKETITHNRQMESLQYKSILNEERRTEVMAYNAKTSRMQAHTAEKQVEYNYDIAKRQVNLGYAQMYSNYSLGREANAIAEYNAHNNRMNAETNQYNAITQRLRQEADAKIGFQNANTNAIAVGVQQQQANTANWNARINQQQQQLRQQQFLWSKYYDQEQINLGYTNIVANLGNTILRVGGQMASKGMFAVEGAW